MFALCQVAVAGVAVAVGVVAAAVGASSVVVPFALGDRLQAR